MGDIDVGRVDSRPLAELIVKVVNEAIEGDETEGLEWAFREAADCIEVGRECHFTYEKVSYAPIEKVREIAKRVIKEDAELMERLAKDD